MESVYIHFDATAAQIEQIENHFNVEVCQTVGSDDDLYFNLLDCDDWEEAEAEAYVQETVEYLKSIGCSNITDVTD